MADHIPNDLLIEILARLPVASLLRFKSVCKPWYSLITSPSFVTKHLNQSITNSERNGNKLLLRLYDAKSDKAEQYLSLNDDHKFGDEYSEVEFPFKLPFAYYFRVVGSYNGLLCLSDKWLCRSYDCNDQPQTIIWNPSTRKSVTLPTAPKPHCPNISVYGFGAHPTTQEYKVIRLEYKLKSLFKIPPKVDIYTQGTRSWRGISSAPPYCFVTLIMWSQAFLNGIVHWVVSDPREGGDFRNLIMSFDMASESFSEIMLPPTLAYQKPKSLSIHVFGKSLAVSCTGERDGCKGTIWLMKEYGVAESWTKLFSSKLLGMQNKTLGFRKNGGVLLASANSLASYAPGTITLAKTFYVDPFMETLLSVE